jgi:hypothetical protein
MDIRIRKPVLPVLLAIALAGAAPCAAQDAELQARVAEIVQYVMASRKAMQSYSWVEKVETRVKNELQSTKESTCQFDSSGKVQKTVTKPAEQPKLPGGLRGRKAKQKVQEMASYLERVAGLVGHYAPPDPAKFQEAVRYGRVQLAESNARDKLNMIFRDFVKKGDEVALVFDPGLSRVLNMNIATFLDGPTDPVMLEVTYSTLPDGAGYAERAELTARNNEVQIITTNAGHRKK